MTDERVAHLVRLAGALAAAAEVRAELRELRATQDRLEQSPAAVRARARETLATLQRARPKYRELESEAFTTLAATRRATQGR